MKKGDVVTLDIVDQGMNGEGIAKLDGFTLFADYLLKGERAEAEITHVKKNFAFAKAKKIIRMSEDRVRPVCPLFKKCGGCDLQHMSYDSQLALKREIVVNCLKKAGVKAGVSPVVPSDLRLEYRNKLQLPFGTGKDGVVLGFYKKESHSVVPLDGCPLHGEWAAELIRTVKNWARKFSFTAYDETDRTGELRHLVARKTPDGISVVIVANAKKGRHLDELYDALSEKFGGAGVYFSSNTRNTNVVMDNVRFVKGTESRISPLAFMQVNDNVKDKIYKALSDAFDGEDTVIDAFSGTGVLTAELAEKAGKAYGIEIVPEAVAAADAAMREKGLKNVTNLCGDCAEVLPRLVAGLISEKPAVHKMNLQKAPFDKIKSGVKTYELRLADEKRAKVKSGDYILFEDGDGNTLTVRVKGKTEFAGFRQLFESLGTEKTTGEQISADMAVKITDSYYSPEKQEKYRALAIEIERADLPSESGIAVVLDPPRKGCDDSVLQAVVQSGADKVFYISCNPATLARDLKTLCEVYNIDRVTPFDMFPQTRHVETLVCLERRITRREI